MNFKEWSDKYYPNETEETLHKMSHAWASGHANMAASSVGEQREVMDYRKLLNEYYEYLGDARPVHKMITNHLLFFADWLDTHTEED